MQNIIHSDICFMSIMSNGDVDIPIKVNYIKKEIPACQSIDFQSNLTYPNLT